MHRHDLLLLWAIGLLCAPATAQPCYDFGSTPTRASWTAAPVALGCAAAPPWSQWPQWHLYTPAHRAPGPHVGFRPLTPRAIGALLIPYRCTGLLFAPVLVGRVRTLGYVVDMPETVCR
ncbi:MAG: hypothetical protein KAI24_21530 [Planctomycetes bacterium]|nr:hypothetical protein [Planctomycetota bacterium]